jgi:hypothetical protein
MSHQKNFEKLVNNETYGVGRQAKATKRGFTIERKAIEILKKHPNVCKIETQVFEESIDSFSQIDAVITTKSGHKIYVPIAKDMWIGTSQQDRLQVQYIKLQNKKLDGVHYCYLCYTHFSEMLNKKFTSRARRGLMIQKAVRELVEAKKLHSIDTLWSYLSEV